MEIYNNTTVDENGKVTRIVNSITSKIVPFCTPKEGKGEVTEEKVYNSIYAAAEPYGLLPATIKTCEWNPSLLHSNEFQIAYDKLEHWAILIHDEADDMRRSFYIHEPGALMASLKPEFAEEVHNTIMVKPPESTTGGRDYKPKP